MTETVVVEIPQGKLCGKKEKSIFGNDFYTFHKIPYAKPPVGELRFQAPQPAEGWTGVRDATEEGTVCPCLQWDRKTVVPNSSEDSLFINVYCKQNPNNAGEKKYSVMVWIHMGGFEFGSGNKTLCGPDYLMMHDVIVVTFNYRLGVLGFLSLETVECPGNFGLKDQQLALKWVKNNISHFGGDPDNITIFGSSAGGASVHYQTLCLSNKGLFKRAIMQSGSVLNRWASCRQPRKNAFVLGKRLGCDTKDDKVLLEFLKKVPAEDLVLNGVGVINEVEGEALGERFLNFTFLPAVEPEHEGAFLTKRARVLLNEGKFLDVPVITGIASRELILGVFGVDDYPRFTTVEEFQKLIPRDIELPKDSEKRLAIAKRIKDFYFKNGINQDNYIDILSDTFFNYGVLKYVKCRITNKNIKSPTYLYKFNYEGDQAFLKGVLGVTEIKGAAHGDEVVYIFKTDLSDLEKMRRGSRDFNLMMRLTRLWTDFAKTGVPLLEEPGFNWKQTTLENFEYLSIGDGLIMEKGFLKERMEFWDEVYTSYFE